MTGTVGAMSSGTSSEASPAAKIDIGTIVKIKQRNKIRESTRFFIVKTSLSF